MAVSQTPALCVQYYNRLMGTVIEILNMKNLRLQRRLPRGILGLVFVDIKGQPPNSFQSSAKRIPAPLAPHGLRRQKAVGIQNSGHRVLESSVSIG